MQNKNHPENFQAVEFSDAIVKEYYRVYCFDNRDGKLCTTFLALKVEGRRYCNPFPDLLQVQT